MPVLIVGYALESVLCSERVVIFFSLDPNVVTCGVGRSVIGIGVVSKDVFNVT